MNLQPLLDFLSSPLGQFILVGAVMLLMSRGYPALVARWPGLAPYLGVLARMFPDAAPRSGEALWELYRTTMRGVAANGKPLPEWSALSAEQRFAYEQMAQGLALAPVAPKTEPPSKAPPDDDLGGPKAPPSIVTLSVLALTFAGCMGLGCGMSPVSSAIVVANASRDAGEVAREELETRCVAGYRAAEVRADVARLDAVCLPLRDAYRGLRGAHLALVTAIQVAEARGDVAALVPAVAATVEASELLARALSGGDR